MDPDRVARLRGLLAGWVADGTTPSLVALVARHGRIVLHEAFGVRHHADTTPTLRRDSIFPISSVSKTLTAAVVMCLADDGLVGLNRPFVDYVPELNVPDVAWLREASVADLLRHTAGIDDLVWSAFAQKDGRWEQADPPPVAGRQPIINKLIHLVAGAPLSRQPGTCMTYSNFGFVLLGDIVRHVSGMPLRHFARQRIFAPLGMVDTDYLLAPERQDRRVYRAPGMPRTLATAPWSRGIDSAERGELEFAASSANATAADLAAFLQMLLNGGTLAGQRVLSRASVAAMTRDQLGLSIPLVFPRINPRTGHRDDVEFRGGGYGYGLFVFMADHRSQLNGTLGSLATFGHLGAGGSCVWADPATGVLGVYLSVAPQLDHNDLEVLSCDLFQNAVHAAVVS